MLFVAPAGIGMPAAMAAARNSARPDPSDRIAELLRTRLPPGVKDRGDRSRIGPGFGREYEPRSGPTEQVPRREGLEPGAYCVGERAGIGFALAQQLFDDRASGPVLPTGTFESNAVVVTQLKRVDIGNADETHSGVERMARSGRRPEAGPAPEPEGASQ